MHTVLLLASLLLVLLVSHLALRSQQRLHSWSHRRTVQGVVLVMPLLSLGISTCDLHHILGHPCFSSPPLWDDLLGSVLALTLLASAVGALLWGGTRLLLMRWLLPGVGSGAGDSLHALVMVCAQRVGIRPPDTRLVVADRPLAWASGWRSTSTGGSWRP